MIKPLDDRVIVKIEKAEERNEMGLIIPDTARDREEEGIVVAVGPGRFKDGDYFPLAVKEGDRVFFGKQSGIEIKHEGEKYFIFAISQILAVLEN